MKSIRTNFRKLSRDLSKSLDSSFTGKFGLPRPVNDPDLCSHCAGISWDRLCGSYLHQPDYWALKESAERCPLCHLLLKSLQTEDEFPAIKETELEELKTTISLEAYRTNDGGHTEDQLFLKCGHRMKMVDVWFDEGTSAVLAAFES